MKRILIPFYGAKLTNYEIALNNLNAEYEVTDKDIGIDTFDGLLIPGGCDIEPSWYHQEMNGSYAKGMDRKLDELQFTLLDKFVKAGKPVFGICRGLQLINVYFGGTLIQHLPNYTFHSSPDFSSDRIHEVYTPEENLFTKLYGERFTVNSSHHQAADKIGEGFEVCLKCDDGTVEALKHKTLPVLCVQFHPERMCYDMRREDTVDGSKLLNYYLTEMFRD